MYDEISEAAWLCHEARTAVLAHSEHAAQYPSQHNGCEWCRDGRLPSFLNAVALDHGEDMADRVWELYKRSAA
jgi:hypothetical protein